MLSIIHRKISHFVIRPTIFLYSTKTQHGKPKPFLVNLNFIETKISNEKVSTTYLNKILNSYVDAERYNCIPRILSFFNKSKTRMDIHTYSTLMKAYVRQKHFEMAEILLKEMHEVGVKPNVVTYTTLIDGLINAGKVWKAFSVLKNMIQEGEKPNEVTLALLRGGALEINNQELVSQVNDIEKKFNIKKTVLSYNVIIGKCKDYEYALNTFEKMLNEGITPDDITFAGLIHVVLESGKSNELKRIHELMETYNQSKHVNVYNAFLKYFCQQGLVEPMFDTFYEMKSNGVSPDDLSWRYLFQCVIDFGTEEQLKEAHNLEKEFSWERELPTWNLIMDTYCKAGKMERAKQEFEKMCVSGVSPDAHTFGILIDGYMKNGQPKEAKKQLELMKKYNVHPDVTIFNSLINGFTRLNMQGWEQEVFDLMKKYKVSPDHITYTVLIRNCVVNNNLSEVFVLFQSMKHNNIEPDVRAYNALLGAYYKFRLNHLGLQLLSEMEQDGIDGDNVTQRFRDKFERSMRKSQRENKIH